MILKWIDYHSRTGRYPYLYSKLREFIKELYTLTIDGAGDVEALYIKYSNCLNLFYRGSGSGPLTKDIETISDLIDYVVYCETKSVYTFINLNDKHLIRLTEILVQDLMMEHIKDNKIQYLDRYEFKEFVEHEIIKLNEIKNIHKLKREINEN